MAPFPVTVRYRYSDEGQEERAATFRGRFFDRSEGAVLNRLRELHRYAARVEVVELLWRDTRAGGAAAARNVTTVGRWRSQGS